MEEKGLAMTPVWMGACVVPLSRKDFGLPLFSPASLVMVASWAL